jgi:redox-sensitive bicupin YhaK (pirin superfamily)
MITIRKSDDRGRTHLDWLDSRHSFSFGDYYDPAHNGFSVLRVINDDQVAPARGFATHPHRDMEIITYVTRGAVEHRDSTGTHGIVPAGEVQRMTAGRGIQHSEMNPSATEPLKFLQIWILPRERGLEPGYEQRVLPRKLSGEFVLVASGDGRGGALTIHQDASMHAAVLGSSAEADYSLASGRSAYAQILSGAVRLNGVALAAGDGAKISGESALRFSAAADSELLLFDLP